MKFNTFLFLLLFVGHSSFATHEMGGEITYRHLSGFTYEIKITTYTHTSGVSLQADRPVLDSVYFGDDSINSFSRISTLDLAGDQAAPNNIRVNTYIHTHTYPHEGLYTISLSDPNRNEGVLNIPNSVNVPFSVQTDIAVYDPLIHCVNNSAIPSPTPIFLSSAVTPYVYNVAAFDPDGDSLSFELIPCNSRLNTPVTGYTFPTGITINSANGEIKWDQNIFQGNYNVAVKISEWRQQIKVGSVVRDFEIIVSAISPTYHFGNTNLIPVDTQGNYAMTVQPGDPIDLSFYFEDSVPPYVSLRTLEETFSANAPAITIDSSSMLHRALVTFQWTPDLSQSRNNPYIFVFRGKTDGSFYPVETDLSMMVFVNGTHADSCLAFPDFYAPFVNLPDTDAAEINIFPNPSRELFTIQMAARNLDSNFDLYDLLGNHIHSFGKITSTFQFSMKEFSKGVYIYKCSTSNGDIIDTGRLVIE